jgi:hypothetical protein
VISKTPGTFIYLNILRVKIHFSEKRSVGFIRLSKGPMSQKRLKTPDLKISASKTNDIARESVLCRQ